MYVCFRIIDGPEHKIIITEKNVSDVLNIHIFKKYLNFEQKKNKKIEFSI